MPTINRENYFDSAKFLKASDFKKGETVCVVEKFEEIKTRLSAGKDHGRPCLRLKGYELPFGLNSTNLDFMVSSFGDDSDRWAGKKITFYKVRTTNPNAKGTKDDPKEVDGLRLK